MFFLPYFGRPLPYAENAILIFFFSKTYNILYLGTEDDSNKLPEEMEDPIVKAEREFFEIIKQEQESRLEQRRQKPDGEKDLE